MDSILRHPCPCKKKGETSQSFQEGDNGQAQRNICDPLFPEFPPAEIFISEEATAGGKRPQYSYSMPGAH